MFDEAKKNWLYLHALIDWLSMDSVTPKTESTKEQTLELLIAISQSVPRMNLTSNPSPMNSTIVNMVREKENEDAEKYRSKLISISYTQSPDVQRPPSLENCGS
ncbi:unnamed protein product [Musa acuminata subsp. burmannicoides]